MATLKFSKLQESWPRVSQAAREMVIVFSVICFFAVSNSSWLNG